MKALVKITTQIKTYLPGETLGNEFSTDDINRLIRKKAVEGELELSTDDDLFNEEDPPKFLSEDEIKKIKSKADLVEYANSIGLNELSTDSTKEQLINAILDYIGEIQDGDSDHNDN